MVTQECLTQERSIQPISSCPRGNKGKKIFARKIQCGRQNKCAFESFISLRGENNYCFVLQTLNGVHKRIKYCLGNGFELLSDSIVNVICQDFKVLPHASINREEDFGLNSNKKEFNNT